MAMGTPLIDGRVVHGVVNLGDSGNAIAGVAGKVIRIYGLNVSAAGTVTLVMKDGSTAFEGARTLIAGVPLVLPINSFGIPYFQLTAGNSFVFTLGSAVQVSGSVWFTLTDG